MSGRGRRLAWGWVAALTFGVHALGAHADRLGMWGDDAIYQSMADSLRRGGPLVADILPGAPGVAKYPLLWPSVIAGAQALGASVDTLLLGNAALWALTAQLVVSGLLPALGASPRARVAAGLVIAVNTVTMDLVPQLMSEPLFTLALTAAATLVVRGAQTPGAILALAACTAIAAGTRSVGGLYAVVGGVAALAAGRRRIGTALLVGAAVAAVAARVERTWAPLPTGDALTVLRYYVSYDVHSGWYADRWAAGGVSGLLTGLRDVAGANLGLAPQSLGVYLAPGAWGAADAATAPGWGTRALGALFFATAAYGAWATPRARPLALLLLVHTAIFLAWTWPFSSRFWLPLLPLLTALVALAADRAGDVGRLALPPLVGTAVLLHGVQPYYAARASLIGATPRDDAGTVAAPATAEDDALDAALAALAARVRPGDVIVGESYVFWAARPLGASAVELRSLVPFADVLADTLRWPVGAEDRRRQAEEFAINLRRLSALAPTGATVWVGFEPRRRDPRRDWVLQAHERGLLVDEGEFGLMRLLSVSGAPPTN